MLKKTVTYTDYNDVERTEDFYFNLTRTELMDMEASFPGGMSTYMSAVSASKDVPKMLEFFKTFLMKAYGQKSDDGKRFIKSDDISKAFSETPAYDSIVQELMTGEGRIVDFMLGIMPADVAKKVRDTLPAGA